MRTYVKPSTKLPDTRVLSVLTKEQLLMVWRDIIQELKNTKQTTNYLGEQYYTYLLITYAWLVYRGSEPNTDFVKSLTRGSFTYLDGFNLWVNTNMVNTYIYEQHIVNDGNTQIFRKHMDKYEKKDHSKVFTVPFEEAKKIGNKKIRNRQLTMVLVGIFDRNEYEPSKVKKNWGLED